MCAENNVDENTTSPDQQERFIVENEMVTTPPDQETTEISYMDTHLATNQLFTSDSSGSGESLQTYFSCECNSWDNPLRPKPNKQLRGRKNQQ